MLLTDQASLKSKGRGPESLWLGLECGMGMLMTGEFQK